MARIVVVGAGFGGITAAVRLAKLRHDVTLVEQQDRVGGRMLRREHDQFAWDRHAATFTLPAVLRDLFRKSGRPLERELDLEHLPTGRRHVFTDGSTLDLPMGARAAQTAAIDEALGDGGDHWSGWLDSLSPTWAVLRTRALERPFGGMGDLTRAHRRTLRPRRHVRGTVRRSFGDRRLRAILLDDLRAQGQSTRSTPAFVLVKHHVERTFGRWQVDGGTPALLAALEKRLAERRVDVRLATRAVDVRLRDGRVDGITTDDDALDADIVVWAAPTPPPALPAYDGLPVIPATVTHLGLTLDAPDLPAETVLHGNPVVTIHTGGSSPLGYRTWTVEHSGAGGEDVLRTLRRRGLNVEDFVVARLDRSPTDLLIESGPGFGWQWQGWRSGLDRPGVGTQTPGFYVVGASAHPGPSLELIGLGAATIASAIGRA